ncbi:phosphotransferase family protein [Glutamicibacter sp.]|uniref:phosphotransferase family protein n=1 Tax=Glutamicibacter sp. TaxID=1931995 RepID=UPI002B485EA4|nr:phosphotransferase [Glutamicibacter sp.]HJX78722.1 phosphotransferase [Glutamicibacter sp.]
MHTAERSVSLETIVETAIAGLPLRVRRAQRTIINDGSAHVVVLLEDQAAIRVTRDMFTAHKLRRRQQVVDSIPSNLGLAVPRSLGPVVEIEGHAAVATEYVSGAPCPAGDGEPEELQRLLEAVSSIDPGPLQPMLNEPLSFCGGANWYAVQIEEVIPRIDQPLRNLAREAIEALSHLEPEEQVFSHGDLGGYNVMWHRGQATGILDWDLSSISGRSTDLASLGVWHGWQKLSKIASPHQVNLAGIRRNTFRLQQLGFLIIAQRPEPEISAAIDRANKWFAENLA